ncbi:MAG TPA: PP2C family protein-serine/threonine phosphatase [Chloroflexota bacterium]|jgi:serine phosphatase RsbU (regulator of sigma subunit)
MELQVAVAKVSKYAVSESGDTLEIVERPHGGLSVVLADGQGSGRAAKDLSNLVAKKAVSLLADGVRDGAVARAVHDFLYHYRHGQVSATLNIVSADLSTRTIVISRNNPSPALVSVNGEVLVLAETATSIGMHRRAKPTIAELPLEATTYVLVYTDGVDTAGRRYGRSIDLIALLQAAASRRADPRTLADEVLARAIELDEGRPNDDMSVVVLAVLPVRTRDEARRLFVQFPLR